MNLKIDIPPSTLELLKSRAADAGIGVEALVVATLQENLESTEPPLRPKKTAAEFSEWLKEWSGQFPVLEHPVDDSRESFYVGREE